MSLTLDATIASYPAGVRPGNNLCFGFNNADAPQKRSSRMNTGIRIWGAGQ